MPAALDGESESGFHRRRDWCGIEFSMLLFIPQNYRSNAAVRCIGHRSVLQRLMQCAALGIAAHCVFCLSYIPRRAKAPRRSYSWVTLVCRGEWQRLTNALIHPQNHLGRSCEGISVILASSQQSGPHTEVGL